MTWLFLVILGKRSYSALNICTFELFYLYNIYQSLFSAIYLLTVHRYIKKRIQMLCTNPNSKPTVSQNYYNDNLVLYIDFLANIYPSVKKINRGVLCAMSG